MSWWVADALDDPDRGPVFLASWVVWVVVSITLHELGHGWAAIRQGDRTPILTGHMTWNPIVHMGVQSLIVFAAIGICWGAMPVDPTRFKSRYGDLIVSAAGPVMNVSLAVVCMVLGGLWVVFGGHVLPSDAIAYNVLSFLFLGAALNVVLVVLNLLPIPPLDGSRMLADLSVSYRRMTMHEQAPMAGLLALIAIFWFAGDFMWDIGYGAANGGIEAVVSFFAGGPAADAGL
jgi:Zn-dependent protease